jgi:hypothetical protein
VNPRIAPALVLAVIAALAAIVIPGLGGTEAARAVEGPNHEVWALDQADTNGPSGGELLIYPGDQLAGTDAALAQPERIDLGGEVRDLCLARTGSAPQRAHMLFFDGGGRHAVLSFVASGHVVFFDAPSREPLDCVDVGVQAHAAVPTPDARHVIVANQNGKLLQRIATDYDADTFTLEDPATLNLATCTTPSGAPCQEPTLRPDNAPICPVVESRGRLAFVTLRGGGLLVVDVTTTPMSIVAEYDSTTIHPNGCGGVESAGKLYVNSGGGTPANPFESDLYAFRIADFGATSTTPNSPARSLVFSQDGQGQVDSHGTTLTRDGRYLWVGDRVANKIVVVDTSSDVVVDEIPLAGEMSADPAPDLMDIAPSGNRVYVSFRGLAALTGGAPASGTTPGVGVVRVEDGGADGQLMGIAPITRMVQGVNRADPHGLRVRELLP